MGASRPITASSPAPTASSCAASAALAASRARAIQRRGAIVTSCGRCSRFGVPTSRRLGGDADRDATARLDRAVTSTGATLPLFRRPPTGEVIPTPRPTPTAHRVETTDSTRQPSHVLPRTRRCSSGSPPRPGPHLDGSGQFTVGNRGQRGPFSSAVRWRSTGSSSRSSAPSRFALDATAGSASAVGWPRLRSGASSRASRWPVPCRRSRHTSAPAPHPLPWTRRRHASHPRRSRQPRARAPRPPPVRASRCDRRAGTTESRRRSPKPHHGRHRLRRRLRNRSDGPWRG